MDDEELAIQITIGDEADREAAINTLWENYKEPVFKHILYTIQGLNKYEDVKYAAADILTQTFMSVRENAEAGKFENVKNFRAYLLKMAYFKAVDYCRRGTSKKEITHDDIIKIVTSKTSGTVTGEHWKTMDHDVIRREFCEFVDTLKGYQHQVAMVMALAFPESLSEKEVVRRGRLLGFDLTTGNVKSARQAIRKKFKALMGGL